MLLTAYNRTEKRRCVATLAPAFALLLLAAFGGCGARDWDRGLVNGYRMMSPYSGMIVVYSQASGGEPSGLG